MKWILSVFLGLIGYVVSAQITTTQYQYWFDNEYVAAVNVAIATPSPEVSFNTTIATASLNTGLHMLNSRFLQSDGKYSIVLSKPFIKLPAGNGTNHQITALQYWFDDNYTSGIIQNLTASAQFAGVLSLDGMTLSAGLHLLHVRFKDNSNVWSSVKSQVFLKAPSSLASGNTPVIDQYEYWFDNNYSARINQSVSNTTQLQLIASIEPSAIGSGLHYIHIRFRDKRKIWSSTHSISFVKTPGGGSSTQNVITAFRYWVDTLTSQGINIGLANPLKDASIFSTLSLSTLDTGSHHIFFQFKDTAGSWSSVLTDTFRQLGVIPPDITITSFDTIFCAGDTASLTFNINDTFIAGNVFTIQLSNEAGSFVNPVTIGTSNSTQAGVLSVTIPPGTAEGTQYNVRVLSSIPADTSAPFQHPIIIKNIPQQTFDITGDSLTCNGSKVYHFNPIQQGVEYTWSLSSGGTLNPFADSATISWIGAGIHHIFLTASNVCGVGYHDTFAITVSTTPPLFTPVITEVNHLLYVSITDSNISGCQWYQDNIAIPGATDTMYQPLVNGDYTVAYTNICGSGPISASLNVIVPQNQTINFPTLPDKSFGDPAFPLNAIASSGLPVTFTVGSGPAILSGNVLTILGAGAITVVANQQGDSTYAAASTVSRTFTVSKALQTVNFVQLSNKSYGDTPFPVAASATTGLPVVFSIISGNASISGNILTLTGAGSITIRAAQAGNQNYLSASTDQIICVKAKAPDSIIGFVNSCLAAQNYSVAAVPGQNYTWSLDGGGTFSGLTGATTSVTWNMLGDHLLRIATSVGCYTDTLSKNLMVHIANAQPMQPPINMYPLDSATIAMFPALFSWAPVAGSSMYDLYIWPLDSTASTIPISSNITTIGQMVATTQINGFASGRWYSWKVIAKSACDQISSAVQLFKVADLPDLIVSNLSAADTVFSGQNIAVDVVIKNIGNALTIKPWYDNLYLSADSVIDANDYLLNSSSYLTSLNIQQSYTKNISVNLPAMEVGRRYLIAKANYFAGLAENSLANNTRIREININQVPLPDLKVVSVHTLSTTFSGQLIPITWTVKNQGMAHTSAGNWRDDIYISTDAEFSVNNSIKIGQRQYNQGVLQQDSSYEANASYYLPAQLFGRYYIHVVTDAQQQVYESAFENNNHLNSDSLIIYLTPPPDYLVQNFNVTGIASRGETVVSDWTIKNTGSIRRLIDSVWHDGLYVGPDSLFTNATLINSAMPLQVLHPSCSTNALGVGSCRYISPLMDAGDQYYNSGNITMPQYAGDSCYVFLKTDYKDEIFEFSGEQNNISVKKIRFVRPDLIITNVQCPAAGFSNGNISVSWSVRNNGPGKLINASRIDRLWLSPTATFSVSTAILLADHNYANSIDSGNTALLQKQVTIPALAAGTYHLFAEADYGDEIVETDNNNNRSTMPAVVQIAVPDPVDISITQMGLEKDSIIVGTNIGITYSVINQGSGNILGQSWVDNIYCSRLPIYQPDSIHLLKTISRTNALLANATFEANDSVIVTQTLLHSMGIDAGRLYFYVFSDASNTVVENNENNNLSPVDSAYVMGGRLPDLQVIAVSGSDSLRAGGLGSVSWTVKNIGGNTDGFSNSWLDGLYISQDTIPGINDIFVKSLSITGPMDSSQGYSRNMGFITPNGLSGNYYLMLISDKLDVNSDANTSNNHRIIRDQSGAPAPTYISPLLPSDLIVTQLEAPISGFSGQPYQIRWVIQNQGTNITNATQWQEGIFLSNDNVLDLNDIPLASFTRVGSLNAGSSYEDSTQVFLPNNVAGNYFLLFKTDKSNAVYESTNENNNTASSLIFITQAPPSDLVLTDIYVDTSVVAGDSILVSWVLQNVGSNPATGYLKEGIYCSADLLADNDDILLADLPFIINLPPGDTVHHSIKVRVKDVSPGNYHALIRTDLLNNITEQDEMNNAAASPGTVTVTTPELPLDSMRYNVLYNNREFYYRIEIPAALVGQSLLVTLKGDSLQGVNELYLRYDTLPTRIKHDFAYSAASSGNQQVIIPSLKEGTYYLMAYGATAATTNQQFITLHAKVVYFSILDVTANSGGNTGNVTIRISGAKFEQGMKARLSGNGADITAASVYFVNSTAVFATFNLSGKPTGLYHVKLVKPGVDSVIALNSFTISQGSGGVAGGGNSGGFYCQVTNTGVSQLLGVEVQHPITTVFNRTFPMTIIFGNSGNVDIPVPTRMLVSSSGHPIAFSLSGLSEQNVDLYLEFKENNAPPNVLRPGAVGYITIFTTSNTNSNLRFKLIE